MEKIKSDIQEILDRFFFRKALEKEGINLSIKESSKYRAEDIQHAKRLSEVFDTIKKKEQNNPQSDDTQNLLDKIEYEDTLTLKRNNTNKTRKIILRIAAVLFPLAIISSIWFMFPAEKQEQAFQHIYVPKGSKTKLVLNDGTKIWLNSESELKFPSSFQSKSKRDVFLSGEAYFEVAKNKKKPFHVHISGFKINVLGTAFNVKAYPDAPTIEATLEHGLINIEKISSDNKNTNKTRSQNITLEPKETIVLYKNQEQKQKKAIAAKENKKEQRIDLSHQNPVVKKAAILKNVDITPYTSWKENKLVFKSKRLEQLLPELERWYNIDIELADKNLDSIICTGTFENETPEQAISALCKASGIVYEIEKNHVILKNE